MENFNTFIFIVAYDNPKNTSEVLNCYINAHKNNATKLILVDNSNFDYIVNKSYFEFTDIIRFKINDKCKSLALNKAIKFHCNSDSDFIICLDNDVEFEADFIIKYLNVLNYDSFDFYYGTSLNVIKPKGTSDLWYYRYLQGSQKGKNDVDFNRTKKKMFYGCSFAFYFKQWKNVNGFDKRFGPGSKHKLGSQESTFQKKLYKKGYRPLLIENNAITHKPLVESYKINYVLKRVLRNGRTHGFETLINDRSLFKLKYQHKLLLNSYSSLLSFIRCKKDLKFKLCYLIGILQSLNIYVFEKDKKSYYENN